MRFGPRLRDAGRRILEEYEVFFQKERASCGFQLIKQGEQNDYIWVRFFSQKVSKILKHTLFLATSRLERALASSRL
jgi:hypothetical protein